jgi:hypothetical protein
LIMSPTAIFLLSTASFFASRAPTRPSKMVAPSESCELSMIAFVLYCFMPISLPGFGQRRFTRLRIYLIYVLVALAVTRLHMSSCFSAHLSTNTSAFLAACVTPTLLPRPFINLLLALSRASSLAIRRITAAIVVTIPPLVAY